MKRELPRMVHDAGYVYVRLADVVHPAEMLRQKGVRSDSGRLD
jgi:hypothetical protein